MVEINRTDGLFRGLIFRITRLWVLFSISVHIIVGPSEQWDGK